MNFPLVLLDDHVANSINPACNIFSTFENTASKTRPSNHITQCLNHAKKADHGRHPMLYKRCLLCNVMTPTTETNIST